MLHYWFLFGTTKAQNFPSACFYTYSWYTDSLHSPRSHTDVLTIYEHSDKNQQFRIGKSCRCVIFLWFRNVWELDTHFSSLRKQLWVTLRSQDLRKKNKYLPTAPVHDSVKSTFSHKSESASPRFNQHTPLVHSEGHISNNPTQIEIKKMLLHDVSHL